MANLSGSPPTSPVVTASADNGALSPQWGAGFRPTPLLARSGSIRGRSPSTVPGLPVGHLTVVDLVFASTLAHLTTLAVCATAYYNYVLFQPYMGPLVWAALLSVALDTPKNLMVRGLKHLTDRASPGCSMVEQGLLQLQGAYEASPMGAVLRFSIAFPAVLGVAVVILMANVSTVVVIIGLFVSAAVIGLVHLLDRRIFWYRWVISDHYVVSIILMIGLLVIVVFSTGFFAIGLVEEVGAAVERLRVLFGGFAETETSQRVLADVYQVASQWRGALQLVWSGSSEGPPRVRLLLSQAGLNSTRWTPLVVHGLVTAQELSALLNSSFSQFNSRDLDSPWSWFDPEAAH
eukprot:RCo043136